MSVVAHDRVSLSSVHGDTTSKMVFGEYELEDDEAISITFGHTKDYRPDLKQVKVGLVVSEDGIPVGAQMLDGNEDDKAWCNSLLEVLRPLLRRGKKDGPSTSNEIGRKSPLAQKFI